MRPAMIDPEHELLKVRIFKPTGRQIIRLYTLTRPLPRSIVGNLTAARLNALIDDGTLRRDPPKNTGIVHAV